MNGIIGFVELLKTPGLTGPEQKKYIEIIKESGNRMLNTVNNIIDISKIETGLVTPVLKHIDIIEKLDSIYDFFYEAANHKGIDLIFDKTNISGQVVCETDPIFFDSIITNLVNNAIKYTHQGSVKFGLSIEKSNLKFYVQDTGIGIPAERQKAIFERFVQADIADTDAYAGSGIGLSITKSYVNMLGGKIWLESDKGNGSVFHFTLPYKTTGLRIDRNTNIEKNIVLNNKLCILIADDDEVSSELLEVTMKPYSKKLFFAETGVEAVDIYKHHKEIDLILMDIKMPGLNGLQATEKIREFDKDVIIVAQTAFAMHGDEQKAKEAGCNGYIPKPINKEKLFELIHQYL
jgi:CheY-like chemotaxis protein/two-component sensor histidine kinase